MTEPFVIVDLARVRTILSETRARHNLATLDDAATLSRFAHNLNTELGELLSDAVEVAFYRTVPTPYFTASKYLAESDDSESDDDSHDFEHKGHCDSCDESWWDNHDLSDCISESEVTDCGHHSYHSGSECEWNSDCPAHKHHDGTDCEWSCYPHKVNHTLVDCENSCSKPHAHNEWHVGGLSSDLIEEHNDSWAACKFFQTEEEAEEAAPEPEELELAEALETIPF